MRGRLETVVYVSERDRLAKVVLRAAQAAVVAQVHPVERRVERRLRERRVLAAEVVVGPEDEDAYLVARGRPVARAELVVPVSELHCRRHHREDRRGVRVARRGEHRSLAPREGPADPPADVDQAQLARAVPFGLWRHRRAADDAAREAPELRGVAHGVQVRAVDEVRRHRQGPQADVEEEQRPGRRRGSNPR